MATLTKRLDTHFAACAAAAAGAAVLGTAEKAQAAIIWSGPVNINIPSTTSGVYLNIVTGVNATTPAGAPGWDINPWSSTAFNVWANNAASPNDGVVIGLGSSATLSDNLAAGTLIDGSQTYGRTNASETTGATAFTLNSTANLIGFRFYREGDAAGTVHYGWARISLSAGFGTQPRTITEYAYEDQIGVGITAGTTPAPGALALLAVGALAGRRGRRRN